jgi:hypothetical protein
LQETKDYFMPTTTDLIGLAIDKNPVDFASTFAEIIQQKQADALEAKKIELAQSVYGSPEDTDDDVDFDDVDFDTEDDEYDENGDDADLEDLDLDDLDLDLEDLDLDLEDITDDGQDA